MCQQFNEPKVSEVIISTHLTHNHSNRSQFAEPSILAEEMTNN